MGEYEESRKKFQEEYAHYFKHVEKVEIPATHYRLLMDVAVKANKWKRASDAFGKCEPTLDEMFTRERAVAEALLDLSAALTAARAAGINLKEGNNG